jgi:hypothetical protein
MKIWNLGVYAIIVAILSVLARDPVGIIVANVAVLMLVAITGTAVVGERLVRAGTVSLVRAKRIAGPSGRALTVVLWSALAVAIFFLPIAMVWLEIVLSRRVGYL